MPDTVLTVNAGSSSLKFAVFRDQARALHGAVEGIGGTPHFAAQDAHGETLPPPHWPGGTHEDAFAALLPWLDQNLGGGTLSAAGHRVVHGGRDLTAPVRVTPAVLAAIAALTPLAPLHQPHAISAIEALAKLRPALPQVACFDTAFHRTMPRLARLFALPRALTESGIERFGFHGLSYEYIASVLPPELARGRVVVAHLGNGASLCALRAGRSVDTTMGLTALDGVPMGTRSGALDPGVVLYLQQARGMDARAIEDLLYHRSGLLGVSGIASDMRALVASDDPHAAEAIALFAFRIARETGALAASLGGIDGFVFTAGIGEHTPTLRRMVCERMAWMGVVLDGAANAAGASRISAPGSAVAVHVIPTDEEAMIARHTVTVVRGRV